MSAQKSLNALRGEIDAIDEAIQDLLMRRTQVVERIRETKGDNGDAHRPGREAQIVRNLVDRHSGIFPKQAVVRVWREILASFVRLQGPFSVAVYEPENFCGYGDLVRSHYGSLTPVSAHQSARRVIDEVMRKKATVGVLPLPGRDDPAPWWPNLMSGGSAAPLIIARLPFAGPGNCRANALEALAISLVSPEKTGRDRSFLALDADEGIALDSLGPALADAGLPVAFTVFWDDKDTRGTWIYLAEIDDFVAVDDRRVKLFTDSTSLPIKRAVVLGSYAIPLAPAELAESAPPAKARPPAGERPATRAPARTGRRS